MSAFGGKADTNASQGTGMDTKIRVLKNPVSYRIVSYRIVSPYPESPYPYRIFRIQKRVLPSEVFFLEMEWRWAPDTLPLDARCREQTTSPLKGGHTELANEN